MKFIFNNLEYFQIDPSIHIIITRNKHQLRRTNAKLSFKNTLFAGIKIFNSLPLSVIIIDNDKAKFKLALRK
jgi:hypothetical protein